MDRKLLGQPPSTRRLQAAAENPFAEIGKREAEDLEFKILMHEALEREKAKKRRIVILSLAGLCCAGVLITYGWL